MSRCVAVLYLAPDIQEEVLDARGAGIGNLRHRDLLPLAAEVLWEAQRRLWCALAPR